MSPKINKKYNKKVITHATLSLVFIMCFFIDVPSSFFINSVVPDIH